MANDIMLELKEDLNRDRMISFFKKHGKILAVLVILGLVGIISYEVWKNYDLKQRSEQGDKLYNLISDFNQLKGPNKLRDIEKHPAYKEVATLVEANYHESQLDPVEMEKAYEKLAKDSSANTTLKELAQLNLVSLKLNKNPLDASVEPELKKLTEGNKTFRFTAMEMLGAYYRKLNRPDDAKAVYEKLANDANAPASLAGRAKSMLSSF